MEQTTRPWYFNLMKDGDSAVVRLLHTSVKTIEEIVTHRVTVDGKTKRVKCIGEGCPLCADQNQNPAEKRIYVHLWNYDDNRDEVWDRTDKILPQLEELEKSWGPLNTAVIKITRKGNDFPKYDIATLNPSQYDSADLYKEYVDKKVGILYSLSRKKEDIETFLKTGKFPEKPAYIPKEEYQKQKEAEKQTQVTEPTTETTYTNTKITSSDLPF